MRRAKMELTTSDRTTLFFETYGDPADRPLVVIHGLGADHEMWAPQIETLPPQGFFLIAPDVRGHGQSSPVETFELQDCARDIAELLDHLEIPQATVAGVSMGGVIVQQFTCDFPDRLDRLILSDSFSEIRTLMEKLAAWSNWLTLKLWPSLFSRAFEMAYSQPHMEQARDYFHEVFQEMDPQQVLQARVALNHFDIIDRLPAVDSPALVVVGDQFGAFAINMARKTADALPNAAFQVLEGGADPSNLTVPDEFDRAILDFLMDRKGKGN